MLKNRNNSCSAYDCTINIKVLSVHAMIIIYIENTSIEPEYCTVADLGGVPGVPWNPPFGWF